MVANYTCNLEEEKRQSELAAAREEAARLKRAKEVAAMEKKRQKEAEAAAAKAKRAEEAQKRREAEAARRLKQVWPLILYRFLVKKILICWTSWRLLKGTV